MASEIVKLAEELIRFNTSHPNFQAKRECFEHIKKGIGESLHVQEFEFEGFPSLLFSTQKSNHFDLLLAGHIDVVSGPENLFQPTEKDDKLFGRGAYDMKGSVAAMIIALKSLPLPEGEAGGGGRNIGLLLTSDEEIDGQNGTKAVLENTDLSADFALLPDNGENWDIVTAERGLIHARVSNEQKNQITAALAARFRRRGNENQDWITTFAVESNFNTPGVELVSSPGVNPGPVDIRIRFVNEGDKKAALEVLQKVASKIIRQHNGFFTSETNPHLQKLQAIIQKQTSVSATFAKECRTNESDAIYFAEHDIPTALVRPLGGGMHQDSEWIDLKALEALSRTLNKFLHTLA